MDSKNWGTNEGPLLLRLGRKGPPAALYAVEVLPSPTAPLQSHLERGAQAGSLLLGPACEAARGAISCFSFSRLASLSLWLVLDSYSTEDR